MSIHADPPPVLVREPHTFQYHTGEQLGKGGFAICHRGEVIENGTPTGRVVALKIVKSEMQSSKLAVKFRTELQLHSKLRHPNIVDFHRAFSFQLNTYVVLEICANGSLADAIKKRKYFTMPEIRRFIIQTCGAVKYLHHRNIVHRDLKTGNLFLDKDMNVKVGDFGLAALLVTKDDIGMRRTTMCGTPNYLAPEILEKSGKGHNEKVDLWAIGIIAYTLAVGKAPFHAPKREDIYKKLQARDYTWPEASKCPNEISSDLRELVGSLLVHEDDRPGPDAIVSHPFFKMTFIPDTLPSSCTNQIPAWPKVRPPNAETVRRGYSDAWYKLCRASGVGEYDAGCTFPVCGGKRVRSVVREVEKELAAGRGPIIPMPPNQVYVPFPEKRSFPVEEAEDCPQEGQGNVETKPADHCLREMSGNSRSLPPPKRAASRSKALLEARARLEAKENATREQNKIAPITDNPNPTRSSRTRAGGAPIDSKTSNTSEPLFQRAGSGVDLEARPKEVEKTEEQQQLAGRNVGMQNTMARKGDALLRARPRRIDSANNSEDQPAPAVADLTKDQQDSRSTNTSYYISPDEVLERAAKLRANIMRSLTGKPPTGRRSTRKPQLPFVTTWVDYTKKFGVAYCLQDGTVGMAQRSSANHPALFWWVRHGQAELRKLRNGASDRQLPIHVFEAHSQGGIRPGKPGPSVRRQGVSWWGKMASYMERSRPLEGDEDQGQSARFVTYYQRVDGVLIFGFDNGSLQLNFPDHTKIVFSPDGQQCDFTCHAQQEWDQLQKHGHLSHGLLDRRTVVSERTFDLVRQASTESVDGGVGGLNDFVMKLQFVVDLVGEWMSNEGLGCPEGTVSKLAWQGVRPEGLDPTAIAIIGGLGCRFVGVR